MEFPFEIFGVHPHFIFDVLAFLVGGQVFWWSMRRERAEPLTRDQKLELAVGCIVGAAVGAKLIELLADPAFTFAHRADPAMWLTGRSIVGAMLGGLAGVEIAKRRARITLPTGDHFALPLALGIAIGRIGCFLSGLTDDAYGVPTTLPWGVDFGDGPRHPTQLYESIFALTLAGILVRWRFAPPRALARGDQFKLLMLAYFAFRFAEEFVRVSPRPYLGFTIYQLACLAGVAYYLRDASARARFMQLGRAAPE